MAERGREEVRATERAVSAEKDLCIRIRYGVSCAVRYCGVSSPFQLSSYAEKLNGSVGFDVGACVLSVRRHICCSALLQTHKVPARLIKQQTVVSVKVQMHLEESKHPQKAHKPKCMNV